MGRKSGYRFGVSLKALAIRIGRAQDRIVEGF